MTNHIFGVIDVGSNSVRLLISNRGQTVFKFATITRLSLGMTKDKILNKHSIKRTIDALSFFKDKAINEFKVEKLFIFATAGVRYAKNKEEFLKEVKNNLGMDVDVVSGDIEAEIGALGALNGNDGGFIDVGGKSTEIVYVAGGKHVYTTSLNIGVVTLTEKFGQDVDKIKSYCSNFIKENVVKLPVKTDKFVCVGGTATTLASISLLIKEYDYKIVDGYVLSKEKSCDIINELKNIPVEDRLEKYCIQPGREDIILSGAILINELLKYFSLNKIVVRDCDNLEGYLIKKGVFYD